MTDPSMNEPNDGRGKRPLVHTASQEVYSQVRQGGPGSCPGKRLRTQQFFTTAANYSGVRQTCWFFLSELEALERSSSMSGTATYGDETNGESPNTASPALIASTSAAPLARDLRDEMSAYERGFRTTCQTLGNEAQETIRLYNSFQCMANNINADSASQLSMIDQGPETNASLKKLIAEYAGVPCEDELADCMELHSLLS